MSYLVCSVCLLEPRVFEACPIGDDVGKLLLELGVPWFSEDVVCLLVEESMWRLVLGHRDESGSARHFYPRLAEGGSDGDCMS